MPIYISAPGLEGLKQELILRTKETRKRIAEKISAATELGDLSENFEYHEAKEQQGLNESRVAQLEAMISDHIIVEDTLGGNIINLGTTFDVEVRETRKTFIMVGSSEADPMAGKISNESPIGQAFMGRNVDEVIEINTPAGTVSYKILSIK